MEGINLCGGTRRQTDPRPLLSIQFQDVRHTQSLIEKLFFGTESQRGVNISTSVLHMHRWLQTGNTELSEVNPFSRTSSQTRVVVESLLRRLISLLCL